MAELVLERQYYYPELLVSRIINTIVGIVESLLAIRFLLKTSRCIRRLAIYHLVLRPHRQTRRAICRRISIFFNSWFPNRNGHLIRRHSLRRNRLDNPAPLRPHFRSPVETCRNLPIDTCLSWPTGQDKQVAFSYEKPQKL
jgi:hypothetical protein